MSLDEFLLLITGFGIGLALHDPLRWLGQWWASLW